MFRDCNNFCIIFVPQCTPTEHFVENGFPSDSILKFYCFARSMKCNKSVCVCVCICAYGMENKNEIKK